MGEEILPFNTRVSWEVFTPPTGEKNDESKELRHRDCRDFNLKRCLSILPTSNKDVLLLQTFAYVAVSAVLSWPGGIFKK